MRRDVAGTALAFAIIGFALAPVALSGGGSPRYDVYHAWAEDTVFTVSEVRPGVFFATRNGLSPVFAGRTYDVVTGRGN